MAVLLILLMVSLDDQKKLSMSVGSNVSVPFFLVKFWFHFVWLGFKEISAYPEVVKIVSYTFFCKILF